MNQASSLFRYLIQIKPTGLLSKASIPFILAWVVSIVFHPLLMPTYLNGLVFKYCTDLAPLTHESKVQILFFIFISTYLIPSFTTGLLWASGVITSIGLEKKSERMIPLVMTGLVYMGVSYIFLEYLQMARIIGFFMASIALTVALTAVITKFWKISSHMVGIGGLLGFMLAVVSKTQNMSLLWPLIFTIIASGAVASSRLYLMAHNQLQIILGFLLGIVVSWSAVHFFI